MKTKAFFLNVTFSLLVFAETIAQWSLPGGNAYIHGNVGIGIGTNLDSKLSINGNSDWHLKLSNDAIGGDEWRIGSTSDSWSVSGGKFVISNTGTSETAAVVIDSQKRVGIGTANPNSMLTVNGNIGIDYGSELRTISSTHKTILRTGWADSQDFLTFYVPGSKSDNALPKIHIKSDGNVGIGTLQPRSRLTVNGRVHAKEVKVDLNIPGADYVFESDYQLMSLPEVERFISINKHLPEIPSAADMEKNGINLSEMNIKLLKKVEELTLHLIDLNKKVGQLNMENEILKDKVK